MNVQNTESHLPKQQNTFLQGAKDCAPTLFGYMSIGSAFGIICVASGLSILEIACLALFVYAGSAQFIICAMLVLNTPISAIILTTFIVNLRHLLLCFVLAPHFTKYSLIKNIGIGALVTDETFGVAVNEIAKRGSLQDRWMNGLNITAYVCWVISCVAGAIFGQWISNPEALGLDFAIAAMFVALLVLQLKHVKSDKLKHSLFLIALMILCMTLLSFIVSTYVAVILSTVIVATIGVVTDK